MADLIVIPSLQLKETDILTVDKLNLMATPVVELSIETPVTDENFFRNGNFYSSFWTTPAGESCPVGVETQNANYWFINPNGAAVTYLRSTDVPDLYSLWSLEVSGATGSTDCSVGAQINGDLSTTLRRLCTWSGYIENNTGALLFPTLEIWTCNAFNDFNHLTLQTAVNLQTVSSGSWGYDTVTIDLSTLANVSNGLFLKVRLPSGALSATTKRVNFSRLKFQLGEVATQFVDDPGLFIQTPSIDSTMLQDGCIARASLFLPNVIPPGTYQAGSIHSGDIGAGQVTSTNLASGAVAANLGYTPVNKAGDTMTGALTVKSVVYITSPGSYPGVILSNDPGGNLSKDAIEIFKSPSGNSHCYLNYTNPSGTPVFSGATLLDSYHGVDTNSYQAGSITLQALSQSLVNLIIPPGEVRAFGGPNIPAGWLPCDGTIQQTASYPNLYAAIGTYWGAGNNDGYSFNLPDLRGRTPLGYVNSPTGGITARSFASKGGEETHQLSIGELASHNHGTSNDSHTHTLHNDPHTHIYVNPIANANAALGSGQYSAAGTANTNPNSINMWADPSASGITINYNGFSQAHNNLHPYAVMYWMIKV